MGKKAICGHCRSENVYGMSRVVGYYSIIDNWNESKLAELKDRQKGDYKLDEPSLVMISEHVTAKQEALAEAR